MTPLLISLLQISVIMSVVAVGLHLIMDGLSNSISPRWKYYVWGIVLLSFLIPFRPKVAEPVVTIDAPDMGSTDVVSDSVNSEAVGQAAGTEPTFWSQIDIPMLILGIWISGIIVFLAITFIKHMRFMNTAKRWGGKVDDQATMEIINDIVNEMNIGTDIDVVRSEIVSVPMMAGVFKPILFLPAYELDNEELKYVIRHEMVHYRKFDILVKLLSILANAVHWFNPLVYMMQRWIHVDCEVACDYEVTKSYEEDERIRYVETIIGVAKHEIKYKSVFSTNFYDGKKTMKKRLESVLAANKMRGALVVILVAALSITCVAAGSALAVTTAPDVKEVVDSKVQDNSAQADGDIAQNKAEKNTVQDNTKQDVKDDKAGDNQVVADSDNKGNNNESTSDNNSSRNEGSNRSESSTRSHNTEPDKPTNTDNGIISMSKAKSIALDRVGGGTVSECELDKDDGIIKYDIKVIHKGYEYEIEINAKTGKIISFEKDDIEDDDDDDDDDDDR